MARLLFSTLCSVLLFNSPVFADDARVAELYKTGLIAKKNGDLAAARQLFREVLLVKPSHREARKQLASLKPGRNEAQSGKRKAAFKALRIKSLDLEKATLQEALETLDYLAQQASGKKLQPNFVVKDPEQKLSKKTVTIRLNNVPLAVALQYVTEQVGAKARYGPYVTAITPR